MVVVGAGAFGGWSALFLRRRGAQVTLVDTWGPGNSRASSGGETRVIRGSYGPDGIFTRMAARALTLWRETEKSWKKKLYHRTGALWMASGDEPFVRASIPMLRESRFRFEELSAAELNQRYPQVDFEGVRWGLLENDAGYLMARRSCADVLEGFLSEGGRYVEAAVEPPAVASKMQPLRSLRLSNGTNLEADRFVFACGPWLPRLFPDVVGKRILPTRQDVLFFGTPAGDDRFSEMRLPIWLERPRFYGIPANERRGFKIADDTRGEPFDPTDGDRRVSAAAVDEARKYLARRFPALKNAPVIESRVCQYENSPDHHFLVDRHPFSPNVWIVGGGSGHGFKHGPALGELVADNVLERKPPEPLFALARFQTAPRSAVSSEER
ncbi:MAG TPA: FAD-dependent oxidoreductase [Thermoanaerobaculia bacterium]